MSEKTKMTAMVVGVVVMVLEPVIRLMVMIVIGEKSQ